MLSINKIAYFVPSDRKTEDRREKAKSSLSTGLRVKDYYGKGEGD